MPQIVFVSHLKRYNGSAWVGVSSVKRYNGSAWVACSSVKAYMPTPLLPEGNNSWQEVYPDKRVCHGQCSEYAGVA